MKSQSGGLCDLHLISLLGQFEQTNQIKKTKQIVWLNVNQSK